MGSQQVKGHTRRNGTYVQPHVRSGSDTNMQVLPPMGKEAFKRLLTEILDDPTGRSFSAADYDDSSDDLF